MVLRRETRKKNSFYCTNSCVLIARTRPKKEKNFFLLHELVPSLIDRKQEKKKVFLLHELVQKFVRNNYHIYVRKKNWHFVLCGKKKIHFTPRIQWNCVVFILRELDFFFQTAWTVSKACQIYTQHINYRHQKKETCLIVPTVKTKLIILHELNKQHESDSYCS